MKIIIWDFFFTPYNKSCINSWCYPHVRNVHLDILNKTIFIHRIIFQMLEIFLPFLSNLLYNISIIHLKYIPTNVMYVPLNSWNAKIWQDLQRLNCSRRPRMNHSCCHLPDVMARNYFAKRIARSSQRSQ